MNFEKDIFISYAHLDNENADDDEKAWITEFEKEIRIQVGEILGEKPVIWRDERLQGNDDFSAEIIDQFAKSRVMVSIVTPRYLKSKWCKDEINYFLTAAEKTGGISVGHKWRIFKIHKTPVDRNAEPEAFQKFTGYDFYKQDPSTGRWTPFDKFKFPDLLPSYNQKLLDLAQDIAKIIDQLKSTSTPEQGTSNVEAKSTAITKAAIVYDAEAAARKIYLADTTSDLKEFHDKVRRALEDKGYTVFPNSPLNRETAESFTSDVESSMKDASLSIHLVGSPYGLVLEGTDKSIVVLQNEIAAKEAAKESKERIRMNRLIWIHSASTNDEKQNAFINQLKNEKLYEDSDLLEGEIEQFVEEIFKNIEKQKVKEKAKADAIEKAKQAESSRGPAGLSDASGNPRVIYMICDEPDLNGIAPVQQFLEQRGHAVMIPSFGGDLTQLKQEHDENLKTCDAVILYWGNADFNWANSRKNELIRLRSSRPQSMPAQIAYIADPLIPQKENFTSPIFSVVKGISGFNPQLLSDFIEKLK